MKGGKNLGLLPVLQFAELGRELFLDKGRSVRQKPLAVLGQPDVHPPLILVTSLPADQGAFLQAIENACYRGLTEVNCSRQFGDIDSPMDRQLLQDHQLRPGQPVAGHQVP